MGLYQGLGSCRGPCHVAHNMQGYLCGGVIELYHLLSTCQQGFVFVGGDTKWGFNFILWLSQGLGFRFQGLG